MSGEADAAVAGPAAGLADEGPGWLWVRPCEGLTLLRREVAAGASVLSRGR